MIKRSNQIAAKSLEGGKNPCGNENEKQGITDAQGKKKSRGSNYYGTFVGNFVSYAHNITGEVYVVDETTFFIKGFSYDGLAENAIFWVGKTDTAGPDGTPVYYPDPRTSEPKSLQRYVNEDIILKLPPHVKVRDIKNLSVWCSRFLVSISFFPH
ncbi:hypothetical protein QAD02_022005 [Eretmocerus hayati]|uniref:Uncharacterized protein n=1 Tax=Eretmocerus hayati TaxID=131215 RepID=A0ACC2PRR9_9HYME|nr:hypothetical protein QAD02_022005 [Eretmocerus hayati]